MMNKLIKPSIWKILHVFYLNRNKPLHLREIARQAKINESTATTHLNSLVMQNILSARKEANLKIFSVKVNAVPDIFPMFDEKRLDGLPMLRKNAIKRYIAAMDEKPVFAVVFGSTAKGTYTDDSDVDILEIFNRKRDTKNARDFAESQTGINIQTFQMTEKQFAKELVEKKDKVVQSAISTGFPVFNQRYYYEAVLK
ncbi:MAG: nucleotidyltransferase domain-containing protein [archaeon]